jgi:hypothetical protein
MRKLVITCVVIVCLGAPVLHSQSAGEGSIRGQAKDDQSAVLQAVKVTATSPDAPAPREVQTDDSGVYRLLDLVPGTYTLTAERDGFSTWVREGIVVRAGLNLSVDIVMKVGAVSETVKVTLATPMLESRTAVNAVNVSGDFQRALPLSTRRLWTDSLVVTPGVVSLDVGSAKNFYVNGTTQGSHVFQVDGMDMMATRQNSSLAADMSTSLISDVQIRTSAVDASAPLGLGAIVDIVSASGSDRVAGAGTFLYQPRQWNDNNVETGFPQITRLRQADLSLGGPIRRRQAWFFVAYRRADNSSAVGRTPQQVANLLRVLPTFEPFDRKETGNYVFLKGSAQLAQSHQLTLSYSRDDRHNEGGQPVDVASFTQSVSGGPVFGARLSSIWGSSLTTRFLVSHNRKRGETVAYRTDVPSRNVHLGTRATGGRLTGTGAVARLDNATSAFFSSPDTKSTVSGDATLFRQTGIGSHELQVGLWAQPRLHGEERLEYSAGGFQVEDVLMRDPSNPALGFVPFRRQIFENTAVTTADVDSRDVAVYVQDSWRPSDRLTISAGIRVDAIKRWDRLFDQVVQDSTEVGPRVGANYRLTEWSTLRGNWGRVHENLSVNLVQVRAGSVTSGFRELYDLNLDGVFETTFVTPTARSARSDRVVDLENYHQEHADEWGVGYRMQLPWQISADAGFLRRAYKDRPTEVETNAIYEGGAFRGLRDPNFGQTYLLTKNIWNWVVYKAADVRVTKQTDRTQFLAGYTRRWRHIEGTWQPNDPASIIQPSAFPNDRGLGGIVGYDTYSSLGGGFFNIPWRDHTATAAGTYVTPGGFILSAGYTFQSGIWSGPIVSAVTPDPRFGPATVPLTNGGSFSNPLTFLQFAFPTRGEGQFTLDGVHELNLRVARDFRVGQGRINVAVDGFNVTNEGANTQPNLGNTHVTFSPFFGQGAVPQAPRAAQVSVGVFF